MNLIEEAKKAIKEEKWEEAAPLLCKQLDNDFENHEALFLLGLCFMNADSIGLAYNINKRAVETGPGNAAAWHNIGKCYHERQKDAEADDYFHKAIKVKPTFHSSLEGLSMSSLNRGDFGACIDYANRAVAENPDALEARINRGMGYLALKRWREGWRDFDRNLGKEKNRKEMIYGNEVRWDGTKGLDIICYGEQGIGDELSFASCIPDLIRDSKSVTIECDGRIEKLIQRSFPTTKVYGTRYKDAVPKWKENPPKFDARVAIGQLPLFYRNKDEDFHGKPYLTPRPEMAAQWRTLLDSLGDKPKIGIAWTGGIPKTGQHRRTVTLDTFAPLFKGFDADWVSLQYKDVDGIPDAEAKYGVKIHDWDWGTRVWDYDQTVALISQLDLVISVCTTVVHAAGGLGKECWCLVPKVPMWRYLSSGEWFPWASSVKLHRQKGSEWPMHLLLGELRRKFGDRPRSGHSTSETAVQKAA